MAGLKADGFDAQDGIREGRQEALESSPMNPSLTGRLEYLPQPNLKIGGSFFFGNTTGAIDSLGSGALTLVSGDIQYSVERFSLRAVGALESLSDADKINAAFGNGVADRMVGFYIEGAYNIMPLLSATS